MKISSIRSARPAPFASARSSGELSLVAFATALLAAFALQAGAFLPRLSPAARDEAAAVRRATPAPAAAVVASQPVPCDAPRG